MKKAIVSFPAFFLIFSAPVLFAQMPVSMPGVMVPSMLEKIGVVAAAGGKVELTTPGQVGRIAQSGQAIFMGDEVKTNEQGHLQILLLDETVFTIGPNSAITIDKFVYDPKSHAGEIKASITKGVFRYVSGKIAAKNSEGVKIKLPTATLGFRGTIVGGSVDENGQGLAALLGPGDNNDSGARAGSFTIDGEGGDHQDVNRTGFGVEFGADGGLSDVFQLSDDQVNGLTGGLGGDQGGGDQGGDDQGGGDQGSGDQGGADQGGDSGGGGLDNGGSFGGEADMGDLSGENSALVGTDVSLVDGLDNITENMDDVSTKGAQDAAEKNAEMESSIQPNITTTQLDDPVFVGRSNVFHYQHFAGYFSYDQGGTIYSGTMKASIDVDFLDPVNSGNLGGAHSVNPTSYVEIDVPDVGFQDRGDLVTTNFPGGPGDVVVQWLGVSGVNGGTFDVTVELQNVETDGVTRTAEQARVVTDYMNSTNSGSGDMIAQIVPGATTTPPSV